MLSQVREGHLHKELERTIKSYNFPQHDTDSQNIEKLPKLDIRSLDSQATTHSIDSITGTIPVSWLITSNVHHFTVPIIITAILNTYTITTPITAAIATTITHPATTLSSLSYCQKPSMHQSYFRHLKKKGFSLIMTAVLQEL